MERTGEGEEYEKPMDVARDMIKVPIVWIFVSPVNFSELPCPSLCLGHQHAYIVHGFHQHGIDSA